jgi:peptide/nickel transport system ATP-binding protein/oligopeptide transport system ATP-binding protein
VKKLLQVSNLKTYFWSKKGMLPAVDGVSFDINRGETLGLVGESGCGKTVTSLSIMKLVQTPPGRYVDGSIFFDGEELLGKSEPEMRKIRGNNIAMIFQEPMTSLNPVYTVGDQIAEVIRLHQGLSRLRQRAMIAMALSCNPKLLVADEPTTALDVTIQAQILGLLRRLKQEFAMAVVIVTHDLGVIAEMAERVVVMYSGKVVEEATIEDLFYEPLHPYTEGLFNCIPRIDRPRGKLRVIEGVVPNPLSFPPGCRFHPRCPYAQQVCVDQEPAIVTEGGRRVACHFRPDQRRSKRLVA